MEKAYKKIVEGMQNVHEQMRAVTQMPKMVKGLRESRRVESSVKQYRDDMQIIKDAKRAGFVPEKYKDRYIEARVRRG